MTLRWSPGFQFDVDASTYIEAVEAADGEALETDVRYAYNDFVIGCKSDGIWSAIKASCIMAGARTLAGALVPLVGTAPTNNFFVDADYDRETGLVGDGSTKYLDSNRNNNADPQNSKHLSVFVSTLGSGLPEGRRFIAGGNSTGTGDSLIADSLTANLYVNINGNSFDRPAKNTGFLGGSRNTSSSYVFRSSGTNTTFTRNSGTPTNVSIGVFADTNGTNPNNCRLSFYSIGESLDLALLDARVTTLVNAIGAAIP